MQNFVVRIQFVVFQPTNVFGWQADTRLAVAVFHILIKCVQNGTRIKTYDALASHPEMCLIAETRFLNYLFK